MKKSDIYGWIFDSEGHIDSCKKDLSTHSIEKETEEYYELLYNYGPGGVLIKLYKTPQAANKAAIAHIKKQLTYHVSKFNEFIADM